MGEKPFLANGSIVEDYRLLITYWRRAKEKSRDLAEKAILSNNDFAYLRDRISFFIGKPIEELISDLKHYMLDRVDPIVAVEAFREVYGIEVEPSLAREKIAEILAGWLIEAGKRLKILSYRGWRRSSI